MRPPLPLPQDISSTQRLAGTTTHWALYALLLAQPFIGWIATSAYPAPIPVFGLFDLPPLWSANRALSDRLFSLHGSVGIAIAGVVVLHVAAACHHHFVRKDRVLLRMITG
jgi:cytochrome b561